MDGVSNISGMKNGEESVYFDFSPQSMAGTTREWVMPKWWWQLPHPLGRATQVHSMARASNNKDLRAFLSASSSSILLHSSQSGKDGTEETLAKSWATKQEEWKKAGTFLSFATNDDERVLKKSFKKRDRHWLQTLAMNAKS